MAPPSDRYAATPGDGRQVEPGPLEQFAGLFDAPVVQQVDGASPQASLHVLVEGRASKDTSAFDTCVRLEDGAIVAKGDKHPGTQWWDSYIAGDGYLFKSNKVMKADPTDFKRLPNLPKTSIDACVAPAYVDGFIYIRDDDGIHCIDMRARR